MENFFFDYEPEITAVVLLFAYLVVFMLAKVIHNLFSSYNLDEQLTEKDNPAVAISVTGYFVGVTIIFVGAVEGPGTGLLNDLISVSIFSIAGIGALFLSRFINEKFILYQFSTVKELVELRNPGTGVVQAASYIASALVIAGAIHGEGGGADTALVFYLLGQLILVIFGFLYEKITPYSVHDEIVKNNLAAGFGFSGGLIAIGIIVMKATSGNFISWADNLTLLAFDAALVLVYLFFVRLFFDKYLLAKSNLNDEIARDKNVGAGLLEMFVAIGFSVVLFYLL
jgi:uncharacterized membrane protein YjfL (UPF0719 family)